MCGAAALPLLLALPANAQDNVPEGDPITVEAVTLHPSAGLMNDHVHDGGEFMIGLRYTRQAFDGPNRSGTDEISDADILTAGYTRRATSMTMDMVMLDLMFAPSDNLTLMVMPHWMRHEMTMVGIDPMAGMDMGHGGMDHGDMDMGHGGHHSLGFGQTMTHATEGFGDTLVSASFKFADTPALKAHGTLGVWLPTGAVDRRNGDGTFVHYGMQGGSGTLDIEPMLTVSGGGTGAFGWGAQASYRYRTSDANDSGFAFGDRAMVTGWTSYRASNAVSLTGRLALESEGAIVGHYNGPHNHSAPSDRQENYGGDVVLAALGANFALPVGGAMRPQLGLEAGVPIYQDLNGIQVPQDWRLSVSLSQTF